MKKKIFKITMLGLFLTAGSAISVLAQGSEYTAVYTQENQVGAEEVAPNGGTLMAFNDYRIEMVGTAEAVDFYLYNKDYSAVESATDLLASVVVFYEDGSEEMIDAKQIDGKFTITSTVDSPVKFYAFQVLVGEEYIGARYMIGEE